MAQTWIRAVVCLRCVARVWVFFVVRRHARALSARTATRAAGLSPDFLVCRSTQPLTRSVKQKLANFCHVPAEHCLGVHDLSNIYRVPLLLHAQACREGRRRGR